jgi:hypothetical protein
MEDLRVGTHFLRRAEAVRLTAQGIYDNSEREVVLEFVADTLKLAELMVKLTALLAPSGT